MAKDANHKAESSYTAAYRVLMEAQKKAGGDLDVLQAQAHIESAPELSFGPGTTIEKILRRLEDWNLVKVHGDSVEVLGPG